MINLTRSFFERPTLEVAPDLLGKTLVFHQYRGIITETEAYLSKDDPASHAARGITPRTTVMFGPAGFSYVYFIYGMYHCLNVVTEKEGFAGGVLIRGIKLIEPGSIHLNGPGKLCKHLGITLAHKGIDMINNPDFCIVDEGHTPENIMQTPRIGIRVGVDRPWRFVVLDKH